MSSAIPHVVAFLTRPLLSSGAFAPTAVSSAQLILCASLASVPSATYTLTAATPPAPLLAASIGASIPWAAWFASFATAEILLVYGPGFVKARLGANQPVKDIWSDEETQGSVVPTAVSRVHANVGSSNPLGFTTGARLRAMLLSARVRGMRREREQSDAAAAMEPMAIRIPSLPALSSLSPSPLSNSLSALDSSSDSDDSDSDYCDSDSSSSASSKFTSYSTDSLTSAGSAPTTPLKSPRRRRSLWSAQARKGHPALRPCRAHPPRRRTPDEDETHRTPPRPRPGRAPRPKEGRHDRVPLRRRRHARHDRRRHARRAAVVVSPPPSLCFPALCAPHLSSPDTIDSNAVSSSALGDHKSPTPKSHLCTVPALYDIFFSHTITVSFLFHFSPSDSDSGFFFHCRRPLPSRTSSRPSLLSPAVPLPGGPTTVLLDASLACVPCATYTASWTPVPRLGVALRRRAGQRLPHLRIAPRVVGSPPAARRLPHRCEREETIADAAIDIRILCLTAFSLLSLSLLSSNSKSNGLAFGLLQLRASSKFTSYSTDSLTLASTGSAHRSTTSLKSKSSPKATTLHVVSAAAYHPVGSACPPPSLSFPASEALSFPLYENLRTPPTNFEITHALRILNLPPSSPTVRIPSSSVALALVLSLLCTFFPGLARHESECSALGVTSDTGVATHIMRMLVSSHTDDLQLEDY
ncbi:hypothetical protein K438DRAFT_1997594 [Mycena galopus ATCC 62051]|nr:hypothetical protein K438DRAFT_1997594 [Mycena galopus ATCC 62051]